MSALTVPRSTGVPSTVSVPPGSKVTLSADGSVALGQADSVDLPRRYRFGARYAVTSDLRIISDYEVARSNDGDQRTIRAGVEVSPWTGARLAGTLASPRARHTGPRELGNEGWQVVRA